MVSLTTVYLVSIILTSVASFGSAFAGKKFFGGAVPVEEPQQQVPRPTPSAPMEEEVPNKSAVSVPEINKAPNESVAETNNEEDAGPNNAVLSIPETDKEEGEPDPDMLMPGGRRLIRRS